MTTESREGWMRRLEDVLQPFEQLPADSHLREALPERILADMKQEIERSEKLGSPPFFGFLLKASHSQVPSAILTALEGDLDIVLKATAPEKKLPLTEFVRARMGECSKWRGGLFDLWVRATLLRHGRSPEFDVPSNGERDTDVRLQLGNRHIRLENTVLTEDDESKKVFDRFVKAKKAKLIEPDEPLFRPGPFDPPNPRGLNPAYKTVRLYAKVFDKLAKNLDPAKSQLADDEPNVLLLSFSGVEVSPDMPGFGWALDGLFGAGWDSTIIDGIDISLRGWLEFSCQGELNGGRISQKQHGQRRHFSHLTAAPKRLSGILLFDDFRRVEARINYNAHERCRLTHAEMAELEGLFETVPEYA